LVHVKQASWHYGVDVPRLRAQRRIKPQRMKAYTILYYKHSSASEDVLGTGFRAACSLNRGLRHYATNWKVAGSIPDDMNF
jgi:hypothetical protein